MTPAGAVRAHLPPGVTLATADPAAPATGLWPAEAPAMARAGPGRRAEFAAGRRAARAAMAALGRPPAAVPQGPDRAPIWPDGIVGSISHGGGACWAVLADCSTLAAIGLDLEPADPLLPEDLVTTICTPAERAWLARHPDAQAGLLARRIFTAKEAAYKCQYALSARMLEFEDLTIAPGPQPDQFSARLLRAAAPFARGHCLPGRWVQGGGLIAAVVHLANFTLLP